MFMSNISQFIDDEYRWKLGWEILVKERTRCPLWSTKNEAQFPLSAIGNASKVSMKAQKVMAMSFLLSQLVSEKLQDFSGKNSIFFFYLLVPKANGNERLLASLYWIEPKKMYLYVRAEDVHKKSYTLNLIANLIPNMRGGGTKSQQTYCGWQNSQHSLIFLSQKNLTSAPLMAGMHKYILCRQQSLECVGRQPVNIMYIQM